MALFAKTEIDVLREALRKTNLIAIEEPIGSIDQVNASDAQGSSRA